MQFRLNLLQVTYDIYKPLFKPNADGKHLFIVSRIMVAFYGLVMACVSVIFYKVGTANPALIAYIVRLGEQC